MDALDHFAPATRAWFRDAFAAPTDAQRGAWHAIAQGRHALVVAPTGSGKTLSAFLWALDQVFREKATTASERTRILYVSPLKALGVDVERNLRSPLVGIAQAARRLGEPAPEITVGVRSGDTPSSERQRLVAHPPDILITTPESLYLMLTSRARETLTDVGTVIVDEVHAVAASKRGAHLAVSLERLDALIASSSEDARPVQRIGLSATVRPIDEVARFLGGAAPVDIVAPKASKTFDVSVVVPIADMQHPPPVVSPTSTADDDAPPLDATENAEREWFRPPDAEVTGSIWPHVEEAIVERVLERTSTIVFANSRRLAERLTARLNEISAERVGDDGAVLAKAHHGSVSKEQRALVEDELKSGVLKCVVATSSLELGIDMGAVDLVIQVESPPSAASGLQRVGRAGHQVGEVSTAALFPKHRGDVLHTAIVTERMLRGQIESIRVPQNPLDILAQQTVAHTALEPVDVEHWYETVRKAAPFRALPRGAYEATLDLLAGRYPSDEFAELRPRVIWDRDTGTLTARPGAQRLAVTSGGTIPDRGTFGVFIAGESKNARVGELDEEMVYESRVEDVFTLGTTSWKIVEITHDRVNVVPAFGQPGKVPFWHGDGLGRPAELGEALGALNRELTSGPRDDGIERLRRAGLDQFAIDNLYAYLDEQRQSTGAVPTDDTLIVERDKDEVGDWRLILHSPHGMPVHAPWALAVNARIRERMGVEGSAVANDDGIVARVPDTADDPPGAELFVFEADELEQMVTDEVGGSALFASRFRESAARALLMPRLIPGKRMPLWQQRQRSAALLDVARKHPTFPIILETLREVLQDVYDLPSLLRITRRIADRSIRLVEVETPVPSPFARDLLFGYVGAFMYEGDSPLAERRAAALSVDPALLGELLGRIEMRELLDQNIITEVEHEAQRLAPDRKASGVEGVADLLRLLGPLTTDEIAARLTDPEHAFAHVETLLSQRRAITVQIAGSARTAAIEDAGRLRDALGTALPVGIPLPFLEPLADPMGDVVSRFARTHGPFTTEQVASRFGVGAAVARHTLQRLESAGRITSGFFLPEAPDSGEHEWCDSETLRRIRMRSLAALRGKVEPVEQHALARFLPDWQHIIRPLDGLDGLLTSIEQLAGVPLPASAWETLVLPSRVRWYQPAMLDELTATGEVVWTGHGPLPGKDGWIALHPAHLAPVSRRESDTDVAADSLDEQILDALAGGGAFFLTQVRQATDAPNDQSVIEALWRLVWAGRVTNDTFAPVRALLGRGSQSHKTTRRAPRARAFRGTSAGGRSAPPRPPGTGGGRWSLVPRLEDDPGVRGTTTASLLLDRYGVVTRGSVQAEAVPGGFAQMSRLLSGFEAAGHCRRGYFIEQLGASQFAASSTIDRIRSFGELPDPRPRQAVTLAATDPANPYGAALAWPPLDGVKHRPGRKAGGIVVLVDGALVLALERGGKTVLQFTDDPADLAAAASSLATAAGRARMPTLSIEQVNGEFALTSSLAAPLREAGFVESTRGLTLRAAQPKEPARA